MQIYNELAKYFAYDIDPIRPAIDLYIPNDCLIL